MYLGQMLANSNKCVNSHSSQTLRGVAVGRPSLRKMVSLQARIARSKIGSLYIDGCITESAVTHLPLNDCFILIISKSNYVKLKYRDRRHVVGLSNNLHKLSLLVHMPDCLLF